MTRVRLPQEMSLRHGIGYSMRRYFVDLFFYSRRNELAKARLILDLGGAKDRKRGQFNLYDYTAKVITANISTEKGTDIVCDAVRLPLADASFDAVICAEVLEHVPEPEKILSEINRVLSPGGRVYITAPFLFPIHADPHDYRRYTAFCWRHMLAGVGLHPEEIIAQGTFWCVLIDMLRMWLYKKVPFKVLRYGLYAIIRPFQKIALYQDKKSAIQEDSFYGSFTTGYGVVAVKPDKH